MQGAQKTMTPPSFATGQAGPGGPPPGVVGSGPPPGVAHGPQAKTSGFEGRELELGKAMSLAIKTLADTFPYAHEMNDALVKAHLVAIQFAKNHGMMAQLVEHDVQTMLPVLGRVKAAIEKTGNRELAMTAMFDTTTCHYQLALDSAGGGAQRTYTSPFKRVLDISQRIGQFDLTEKEIHETWTVPRYHGYARVLGIRLEVSPWREDGVITVRLAD